MITPEMITPTSARGALPSQLINMQGHRIKGRTVDGVPQYVDQNGQHAQIGLRSGFLHVDVGVKGMLE